MPCWKICLEFPQQGTNRGLSDMMLSDAHDMIPYVKEVAISNIKNTYNLFCHILPIICKQEVLGSLLKLNLLLTFPHLQSF